MGYISVLFYLLTYLPRLQMMSFAFHMTPILVSRGFGYGIASDF